MSEKLGPVGGSNGEAFDDGIFDGVKKVIVGKDFHRVNYIKIEYEKDGKFETREHGRNTGDLREFSVNYPDEYITAVGGSYDDILIFGGATMVKSLFFKTSYSTTSPILGWTTLFGKPAGKEFMLEGKNGGKLLGFHGRSGRALDAIGPYFAAVDSSLKHFKRQGGNGGVAWDDGAFDGVRKVLVGRSGKNVGYVSFEYVKGERTLVHSHGKRQEAPQEFVVDYPNEHITSVEGTTDEYLTSLMFKTSKGRTFPASGDGVGSRFVFKETGFKLVGFFGRSGDVIDALGAHFAPLPASAPPNKVEAQGGNGGTTFDDGAFDHVRKVHVGQGESGVAYVKFDYEKDGKIESREHGQITVLQSEEFAVDPDDYITSIEVSVDNVFGYKSEIVTALVFKTFKGITSQPFGMVTEKRFVLKDGEGGKLAGFHGKASDVLYALGAYFASTTTSTTPLTPSTAKKLEAKGGNGGASWDDGVFDGVKKISVGQGTDGVAFVSFEYNKGSQALIIGDGHGKQSLLEPETFELDYPSEYITSVEGYYDKIFGIEAEVVTCLTFKTNKRTSQPFGLTGGEHFELKEEGYKIVGFHGKANELVHQIGVHVVPISTS